MTPRWRAVVVGIGSGAPGHLTGDAVAALREVDVFLVPDKRSDTADLVALRADLCAAVIGPGRYRLVGVPDPVRVTERGQADYVAGVSAWHAERAARQAAAVRVELPTGGVIGFLVWGDPSLYDGTLRQLDLLRAAGLQLSARVVPGLSSPTLLAAAHQIVLNGVGRSVHVTTGRRLVAEYDPGLGDVVVMLDGDLSCRGLLPAYADLAIFWGAQLGLPDQTLVAGRLGEVIEEITARRAELRRQRGWVMDTYLLRPDRQ